MCIVAGNILLFHCWQFSLENIQIDRAKHDADCVFISMITHGNRGSAARAKGPFCRLREVQSLQRRGMCPLECLIFDINEGKEARPGKLLARPTIT